MDGQEVKELYPHVRQVVSFLSDNRINSSFRERRVVVVFGRPARNPLLTWVTNPFSLSVPERIFQLMMISFAVLTGRFALVGLYQILAKTRDE